MITKADVIKRFGDLGPRELARKFGFRSHGTIIAWPDIGPLSRSSQDRIIVSMVARGQEVPAKWMPK